MNLKKLELPANYNYIACFLTLECNLNCNYCINIFSNTRVPKFSQLGAKQWIQILNRITPRDDLPITLQGGEPALHPDFIRIINSIREDSNIDVLTNLTFDVDDFIAKVNPRRFKRDAPYASIRVTYHPFASAAGSLINKILKLQNAGFSIGVYGILHPEYSEQILNAQNEFQQKGVDFRIKEFLGEHKGTLYGTYKYPDALSKKDRKNCLCRTSELIIAPDGNIYRCHHDLYKNFPPLGNLLNPGFKIKDVFRECSEFGDCNPCDVKLKTDRFQIYGHTSVEIKDIDQRL